MAGGGLSMGDNYVGLVILSQKMERKTYRIITTRKTFLLETES